MTAESFFLIQMQIVITIIGRPGWPAEMGLKGQSPFRAGRTFPQNSHKYYNVPTRPRRASG
jgi:hypothetical protein